MMRARARRLAFGLATLAGRTPRGFFIPYRYAAWVSQPAERDAYAALLGLFATAEPAFAALLSRLDTHGDALRAIGPDRPPEPRWNQDWFPRLDAAAAYVLVRDARPARIVEVGSGHSTRFMSRAIRDGELDTRFTAIDPAPRAVIDGLPVRFVRTTLQDADAGVFAELADGDVLFIDSSHILMPGTDVDHLFNAVLPRLPAGVLVHIHDVFLPDAYPAAWAWRGYNEQLAVATLVHGGGYDLVWASRYVATRMADRVAAGVAASLPLKPGAHEASLWLRKR